VQRLIEQPADVGDLFDGSRRLGRVHYHLSVYQNFSPVENEPAPANLDVEGRISPVDPPELPARQRRAELTLHLADGRMLDFSMADETGTIRSTGLGLHSGERA
jgi:hypothetical protein